MYKPLKVERLEDRRCLATIGFAPQTLIELAAETVITAVEVGDINGDANDDFVISSSNGISWIRRVGVREFEEGSNVTDIGVPRWPARVAGVGDIDLDGDLDILARTIEGLSWFTNVAGKGDFEHGSIVRSEVPLAAELGDLDADGDLDVVAAYVTYRWAFGEVAWYENIDRLAAGVFGPSLSLPKSEGSYSSVTISIADLNGDGNDDIVVNNHGAHGPCGFLGWFEGQNDYVRPFGPLRYVDGRDSNDIHLCSAPPPAVLDLDADGDLDILGSHGEGMWWLNNNGEGGFSEPQSWEHPEFHSLRQILPADVDHDGDVDIVIEADFSNSSVPDRTNRRIAWLENIDANLDQLHFVSDQPTGLEAVRDVDGDGDLDILASAQNRVLLFESDLSDRTAASDLNADGRVDLADFQILAAHFGKEDVTSQDGDLNGDRQVTFADFLLFALDFGKQTTP